MIFSPILIPIIPWGETTNHLPQAGNLRTSSVRSPAGPKIAWRMDTGWLALAKDGRMKRPLTWALCDGLLTKRIGIHEIIPINDSYICHKPLNSATYATYKPT